MILLPEYLGKIKRIKKQKGIHFKSFEDFLDSIEHA